MALATGTNLDARDRTGLLIRVRDGDQEAFDALFSAYGGRVFNLALRSTRDPGLAEDLCQEVWLRVHRELGSLQELDAFPTWLYRLTSRLCIDAARRRRPASELRDESISTPQWENPEEQLIASEDLRLAWEALGALPARQHICLYLRHVEGMSYSEISEVLDCPVSAVETLLFRARRSFARSFHDIEDSPALRCANARHAMAALIDGESTALQRQMVEAHTASCAACRQELRRLQGADSAYGSLPLAPVPFTMAGLAGLAAIPSTQGVVTGISALLALKGKLLGIIAAASVLAGGAGVVVHEAANDGNGTAGPAVAAHEGSGAEDPATSGAVLAQSLAPSAVSGLAGLLTTVNGAAGTAGSLLTTADTTESSLVPSQPPSSANPLPSPSGTASHPPSSLLDEADTLQHLTAPLGDIVESTVELAEGLGGELSGVVTQTLTQTDTLLPHPALEDGADVVTSALDSTQGVITDTVDGVGDLSGVPTTEAPVPSPLDDGIDAVTGGAGGTFGGITDGLGLP